jgi:tRNA threonylcarbamoyladenosine biosynthesis protein TsaE
MYMQITTSSEKETFAFAKKYAARLRGGEVIGLSGDLGAGKTVFVKGLAAGLGARATVTSPTFVLMKIYPVRKKSSAVKYLCHIDAYRLSRARDLLAIGAEEYFGRADTVTVIEWADKIKKILPKKTRYVKIKNISDASNQRILEYQF